MKAIVLSSFIFFILAIADQNLLKYNEMFLKICRKRDGLSDKLIEKIPYVFKEQKIANFKKHNILNLIGIVGDRVEINGKWYKRGDIVLGYRVLEIKNEEIILEKDSKKIELLLRKRDGKIKITKKY